MQPLQTAADVRDFLSRIAMDLCVGRLEPKRANALCYIATSLLKAIALSAQLNHTHPDAVQSRPRSFESAMESVKKKAAADALGPIPGHHEESRHPYLRDMTESLTGAQVGQ